ncbi:MAG: ABC transporter ATP-binding protein, partial [Chloroflexi bacterium]
MSAHPSNKTNSAPPPPLMGHRGGGPGGMFREVEKSKNTRGTLLRLWGYLRRQTLPLAFSTVLVMITAIVGLLGPFLMGKAIDTY